MPDSPPQIPRLERLRRLIDAYPKTVQSLMISRSFAEELYRELEALYALERVIKIETGEGEEKERERCIVLILQRAEAASGWISRQIANDLIADIRKTD